MRLRRILITTIAALSTSAVVACREADRTVTTEEETTPGRSEEIATAPPEAEVEPERPLPDEPLDESATGTSAAQGEMEGTDVPAGEPDESMRETMDEPGETDTGTMEQGMEDQSGTTLDPTMDPNADEPTDQPIDRSPGGR